MATKKTQQPLNNSTPIPIEANLPFLHELQGNILNGHGRDYAVHIFVRFPRPAAAGDQTDVKVREWIAHFATDRVTSAYKQAHDSVLFKESQRAHKAAVAGEGMAAVSKLEPGKGTQDEPEPKLYDGGTFAHFSLTKSAYQPLANGGLGLGDFPVPRTPPPPPGGTPGPVNDVFKQGLKSRQAALFDPPAAEWDSGYQTDPDALIILADDLPNRMIAVERVTVNSLLELGAAVLQVERGHTLWKKFPRKRSGEPDHGIPIEHFGYADGVSQPLFTDKQVAEDKKMSPSIHDPVIEHQPWNPFASLNLVLVQDPGGEPGVGFGSYMVFRKLEQNVQAFKKAERALAKELGVSEGLSGAMAVGRFEDATPLVLEPGDQSDAITNNFNYDGDPAGRTCPFQAHIRKSNPRLESVRENGPFAGSDEIELAHRIARRGVPYGGSQQESEDLDTLPTRGLGLLFMCYQSNIENQFEFIQRFWCNNPLFLQPTMGGLGAAQYVGGTGIDAVIGQDQPGLVDPFINFPAAPAKNWPAGWGQPTRKVECPAFEKFVTVKGGDYFFSPSVGFLRGLASSSSSKG